jgi:hypothetical protein
VADVPGDQRLAAWQMSTPAIKTELHRLLVELRPRKGWRKNVTLAELVAYAVDELSGGSADVRELRALELALVIHRHERR